MKPESSFDTSRRPCATARHTRSRRWAPLVAACGLSIGCLAAAADSAWEADWPVPPASTAAAAPDNVWEADWPVSSASTATAAPDNVWEADWPVSPANTTAAAPAVQDFGR